MINFRYKISDGDAFDDAVLTEDLLNDDVLNDDELEEEFLNPSSTHDEDTILNSPHDSTSSKSLEAPSTSTAVPSQQKKVVLKRKLAQSLSSSEIPSDGTNTGSDTPKTAKLGDEQVSINGVQANNGSVDEPGVVKLSELTMKERLELRAKKFGAAPSLDALKKARAERFGLASNVNTSSTQTAAETAAKPTAASSPEAAKNAGSNVDILKKRAERFGGSVSNVMVTIENKEKLLKRQQRFEVSSNTKTTAPAIVSSNNEYAEKAKLRAERFKTST